MPPGGFNLAFGDSTVIGENDGDILISLTPDHTPTEITTQRLRKRLHEKFPDIVVFFEAANITNQILNSGLPAPIDVQVTGRDAGPNYEIARRLSEQIARIPGAADVHVHQVVDAPELRINVDRIKAGQLGLTQSNVASSLLISFSGSSQVAPNFWLNWKNGVSYNVLIQTPQYKLDSARQTDANAGLGRGLAGGIQYSRLHGGRGQPGRRLHRSGAQSKLGGLRQSRRAALSNAIAVEPCHHRTQHWAPRSRIITTCSRCLTCTRTSTAGTWAAWPRKWKR